jgi:transposase
VIAQVEQVQADHPDKQVKVYFQDEARFGQQGTLTRLWARTGSRPTAVKQTQYDYLYVFTAVCPETGDACGLIAPHVNTVAMNVFLKQFSRELPTDVHGVMILDRAGFHTSKAMSVPDNVSLIHLPPYSPELNPVENLWHYLRSHHWSNRAYADYAELHQAALEAWRAVCLDAAKIKSVCAAPYLQSRGVKT